MFLKSFNLPSATRVNLKFKLKLNCPDADNKWKQMGLDAHLQATTLTGLIDKYRGASNFLNDHSITTTRTLICRANSRQETLDLTSLVNQDAAHLLSDEDIKKQTVSEATHVIVGVEHGAEAYCVLSQDFNLTDKYDREESEEKLSKISSKMKAALEDDQDVAEFKQQFSIEEKQQINRLVKCRVYTDLRVQPVSECNVFDAYKHCRKLVEEIQKTDSKAVVLAVLLCPLKAFTEPVGGRLFRDVDSELITRCCYLWSKLESVCALADAIRATMRVNRDALRQFEEAVVKYQQLLKASLKVGIAKARQSNGNDSHVERIVKTAETRPLFRISRLEQWLHYKKAEIEVAGKMCNLTGITLISKSQLEGKLADSFDMKYVLVLSIPPLDDRTNEILFQMKNYVDRNTELVIEDGVDPEEQIGLPWHMVQHKRKQVLGKIRELADHVEKNKHLNNIVQFFLTPRDSGKGYWCRYSIYEGENLLKDNLSKLPGRPTNVRVNFPSEKSIRVEWDHEDWGYPCYFVIEYRLKDSSELWTEQKTTEPGITEITIRLKTESVLELRVAADCCIGRSEFSDVIDSENLELVEWKMSVEEHPSAELETPNRSSESQPKMEQNHDLWNCVVKESGILSNISSLSPLEKALRQFCNLLEPLGKQIDGLYRTNIAEQLLKNASLISDLLTDVKDWLVLRRREIEKISSLLNGSHLSVFDLVDIESRKPSVLEKRAKIFILKVEYVQDPLIERICKLCQHSESVCKWPIFPFVTYEEKRLEFIAKTLYTFAAIESIASRLGSDKNDTTYQIGLVPISSSLKDGTITTIDYPEVPEDVKPDVKTLQRALSVNSIQTSPGSIGDGKSVESRLLLNQLLKAIQPELDDCFVDIENMELFRRTIVKVARNCAVQKSEMRLVIVDCAGDRVAYNCRRCEKTCEEPIKIRFMNLSKLSDSGKLCKLCRCPEVEHLFQQFEWRYKAVKITTTLLDMKKEFEANCQPMTTEKLLVFCAEEIEKMRAKVLNLLDQVCARCPESTCSVDYLIKLLKSRVIYEHGPDYLVRLVTLSNLQVGDQRASKKIKSGSNGSKTSLVKCFSSVDERLQDAGARFRSN